jgi:hypothetical protein
MLTRGWSFCCCTVRFEKKLHMQHSAFSTSAGSPFTSFEPVCADKMVYAGVRCTIAYMPQYGWRCNAQLSSEAQWRVMQHYPALLLLGAVIPFARRKVVEIPPAAIDRMLNVLHILKQLCCTFRVQSFVCASYCLLSDHCCMLRVPQV